MHEGPGQQGALVGWVAEMISSSHRRNHGKRGRYTQVTCVRAVAVLACFERLGRVGLGHKRLAYGELRIAYLSMDDVQ